MGRALPAEIPFRYPVAGDLAVRYCVEVKQKNAGDFIERGALREISFIPEIAAKECWDCQECFPLCPTSFARAAYFLTEVLACPGKRKATSRSA